MPATRIPVIRNSGYQANGLKSYIYALLKFNGTPSHISLFHRDANKTLMMKAADGTQHAVTSNNQQNDAFFTTPVQIGTPAQTLQLVLDSGSADTWCWSTDLSPSVINQGKQNAVFDPTKSSTFKKMAGSTWQIKYGDQSSASGTVGTDTLKLGDISVENQAIEVADTLSPQFTKSFGSGLLGLSFGEINTVKPKPVKTPVENMIAQQDITSDKELWTCYLGSVKDTEDPDKGESFFTFGSIDNAAVKASGQDIAYTPVDSSMGFWMFDSVTASVNGKAVDLPGNKAIADTGTTLCMVSSELCEAIYSQIDGAKLDDSQGGYVFPASTSLDDLPQVTVAVGGNMYNIEKEHLAFAPTDDSGEMVFGGIQPRGDINFDIFGDAFLMGVYAIFDFGNKQFGCVQRADPTPAGSGTAGQKFKNMMKKAAEKMNGAGR